MIDVAKLISEFLVVAEIAGLRLADKDVVAETHIAPHQAPKSLPKGR